MVYCLIWACLTLCAVSLSNGNRFCSKIESVSNNVMSLKMGNVINEDKKFIGHQHPYHAIIRRKKSIIKNIMQNLDIFGDMNIHENLIKKCKSLIPPLTQNLHKGQNGRIGIIGGCEEYTGAPYYAAISALRTGADLVYVFCFKSAAPVIKSFSPELIVLPYLDSPNALEKIKPWLKKLHSLVVGPGLGNDPIAHDSVRKIFQHISGDAGMNDIHLPIIVDADSLNLIEPETFKNYNGHIYLTPNVVEFSKLSKRLIGHQMYKPTQDNVKSIINKLDGKYVIVLKSEKDIIANNKGAIVNSQQGSARRCGGQGDILAGSMGTFAYWATKVENYDYVNNLDPEVLAAYAASSLTKHSNKITFELKKRHMITTDIIKQIPTAFQDLFE